VAQPAPLLEPARRDVIVIGASAGGVQALRTVVRNLPEGLPGTVFVVLHMPMGSRSSLPSILDRAGHLPAREARDGEEFLPGTVLVAPPDHHLLIQDGQTRLVRGPKVNGYRPAVDVLFHSAARWYGPRVIGVVLSGALSDGAEGLQAIKRHRGAAVVQSDAVHPSMPVSAVARADVDAAVPAEEIAASLIMLIEMSEEASANGGGPSIAAPLEMSKAELTNGTLTGFTCPECGGPIWELEPEQLGTFACHVGHRFSAQSMLEQHREAVERALWGAIRILDERAALVTRLAERMTAQGGERSAQKFAERAREAAGHADVIRALLEERSLGEDPVVQEA
jgi:two-component system chemotaxis response regulator CheB